MGGDLLGRIESIRGPTAPLLSSFLSRARALALLVAFALLLGWAQGTERAIAPLPQGAPGGAAPYSDVRLYRDVASAVADGEGYYPAVARLHREHGFPLRPFVTVRLPTLGVLLAAIGETAARLLLAAIIVGGAIALSGRLGNAAAERIGSLAAVLAGGAVLAGEGLVTQHELWAGALLTLALASRDGRCWKLALLAAAGALAIRELALPFVALAALAALLERQPKQALAWLSLAAACGLGLLLHARAVIAVTPADALTSPGWLGLRGPGAAVRDLVECSILVALPARLAGALAVLPLLGWLAAPRPLALSALAYAAGWFAVLAIFARDQTFYWALMLLPWWFAGFALVPRAVSMLARALLARGPAGR